MAMSGWSITVESATVPRLHGTVLVRRHRVIHESPVHDAMNLEIIKCTVCGWEIWMGPPYLHYCTSGTRCLGKLAGGYGHPLYCQHQSCKDASHPRGHSGGKRHIGV